ncbi:cytochrome P450 [Suillus fuscotomentosus]|uniref:Cytochrome P450 n=1 Tax=Suillus fuscotomentosus TaxID=1912939 RepID=A0AAD4HFB0_9AGAM|nr:cytochrome P450 [Suillus fuscotomentosus]KAG1894478.1 cytochrome P450 [Suillus fuscotomentosus]
MLGELMGLGQSFRLLRYCAAWKQQRKLAHLALNAGATKEYSKLQTEAVVSFLDSLIENPSDFIFQLRLAAGRIVLSMTYDVPVKSSETMNVLEIMMATIGKGMMPGAYTVDMFPWLRYIPSWVPFNNIHTIATEGRTRLLRVVGLPFAKQQFLSPSPTASFTATCLQTMGTILAFILAIALYPDIQTKIRMELDRVVGHRQLPTLDDRSRLPYVNAAIKEMMRWNPVVPLSLPRFKSKEDVYQGFRVPKGTIVFPNIWSADVQDDISGISPDEFAPERFLDDCVERTALDPYSYAFGFGRRICPGRFFADNSVFLSVTGLVSTFVISPTIGSDGRNSLLRAPFRQGMMRFPESFHVCILPRSEQLAEELHARAREMSKNGSE